MRAPLKAGDWVRINANTFHEDRRTLVGKVFQVDEVKNRTAYIFKVLNNIGTPYAFSVRSLDKCEPPIKMQVPSDTDTPVFTL